MAYRTYREWPADRAAEFLATGLPERDYFPHRCWYLPKCGPEGMYLADRQCRVSDPNALWQVVLFATGEVLDRFPAELFGDDDPMWPRQQFGQPGHIAYALLVRKGDSLYATRYQSDVAQRISWRPDARSGMESGFHAWPELLLNSVLAFALERGIKRLYSPRADLVMRYTDPRRDGKRQLFESVYDRVVDKRCDARREGEWWVIDMARNRERVVLPERVRLPHTDGKRICVCHDLERGWGCRDSDPPLAREAEEHAARNLDSMLAAEASAGIRATYHVVGKFFDEVREPIAQGGHCLAFHSYDHTVRPYWRLAILRHRDQLQALRQVDGRLKGFRPPQSRQTPEWSDRRLCRRNFEWLASSAHALRLCRPAVDNRLAKIPIAFDDYPLYRGRLDYDEWERRALQIVEREPFVAFATHDSYAPWWLPHYRRFLDRILECGSTATLDEVADSAFLASAR